MGTTVDGRSFVICKQPGRYIGWPTIARRADGELIIAFSGDRDEHVCPYGKTQIVRSTDGGVTWSDAITVNDGPLDDRDAGVLVTRAGSILVSWFTSLAFEEYAPDKWKEQSAAISDAQRDEWLGNWITRSTDGGLTWSPRINSLLSTPHGPIELADGRLLYFGINRRVGSKRGEPSPTGQRVGAAESRDDGLTWNYTGFVPLPDGVDPAGFHEPHVVETADGTLVAMIRHHGEPGNAVLWQTESADGGTTWTQARPTEIWGLPPHLVRLHDDRLLVVYGHRREPFGERACLSADGGKSWDYANEIVVCGAPNGDLGYPASIQMDEQTILTIYYQIDQPGEKTCLMGTLWKLPQ